MASDDRLNLAHAPSGGKRRPVSRPAISVLRLQSMVGNAAVTALVDRHATVQRSGCGPGCSCGACGGSDDKISEDHADTTPIQRAVVADDDGPGEELPRCSFGQEPGIAASLADEVEELSVSRKGDPRGEECSPTTQQNATVVCDGRGGFRVHYGAYENRPWLKPCVTKHEQSHIRDFQRDAPNSCRSRDGTPICDGERAGDHIRFARQGIDPNAWQRKSECSAPHIGHKCGEAALAHATLDYEQSWRAYIKNEQGLIDSNCG
jgi:hypothetical protein